MSLKSIEDTYPPSLGSSVDSAELDATPGKKSLAAAAGGGEAHPAHQSNLDQSVRRNMLRSALLNLYDDKEEPTDSQEMSEGAAQNKVRRDRLVAIGAGSCQVAQEEC